MRFALRDAPALFPALSVRLHAVPPVEAVKLARARNLTTYDAAHLRLTAAQGAELVTLDEDLARSWSRHRAAPL